MYLYKKIIFVLFIIFLCLNKIAGQSEEYKRLGKFYATDSNSKKDIEKFSYEQDFRATQFHLGDKKNNKHIGQSIDLKEWNIDSASFYGESNDSSIKWIGKSRTDSSIDWIAVSASNQLSKKAILSDDTLFKFNAQAVPRNISNANNNTDIKNNNILKRMSEIKESLNSNRANFLYEATAKCSEINTTSVQFPTEAKLYVNNNIKYARPSIYDLMCYVPYVGNQGNIYSCSAWAIAGIKSIVSNISNRNNKYTDLNRDDIQNYFSPSFIFSKVKSDMKDNNCANGIDLLYALNVLKSFGVVLLNDYPYYKNDFNCIDPPITDNLLIKAKEYTVSNYKSVNLNIINFQYVLNHNCPIAVEALIDDDFLYTGNNWKTNAPFIWDKYGSSDDASERKSHSMVCVGYSDNKGAFLMLNSFGSKFGNNGFFWIDYDFMFKAITSGYYIASDEFKKQQDADKSNVNEINNIAFDKINEKNVSLSPGNKIDIFNLTFKCTSISIEPNNEIVFLRVFNANNIEIRHSIPLSRITSTYFKGDDGYDYYIQIQSIDPPKTILFYSGQPKVNLLIRRAKK